MKTSTLLHKHQFVTKTNIKSIWSCLSRKHKEAYTTCTFYSGSIKNEQNINSFTPVRMHRYKEKGKARIEKETKIWLMRSYVTFIFLYACESWTLTAELQKNSTSDGNEVLLQDTTHLIQRPCCQWGIPCQDPAGNRTTRNPPDDRKETQTAVVWSCLPFSRFGQNHLARHSERREKTRQTEDEMGRQHQGMDRPEVCQVLEGGGEQRKTEKTGREIICGAPTTLAVKGLMMMMMTMMMMMMILMMKHKYNNKVKPTVPKTTATGKIL